MPLLPSPTETADLLAMAQLVANGHREPVLVITTPHPGSDVSGYVIPQSMADGWEAEHADHTVEPTPKDSHHAT